MLLARGSNFKMLLARPVVGWPFIVVEPASFRSGEVCVCFCLTLDVYPQLHNRPRVFNGERGNLILLSPCGTSHQQTGLGLQTA